MSGIPKDNICQNRGREETQCRNLAIGIALGSLASFVRPWSAKPSKSGHDGDGSHNSRLFGVSSYIGCEERIVLNEGAVERGGLLTRVFFILALVHMSVFRKTAQDKRGWGFEERPTM